MREWPAERPKGSYPSTRPIARPTARQSPIACGLQLRRGEFAPLSPSEVRHWRALLGDGAPLAIRAKPSSSQAAPSRPLLGFNPAFMSPERAFSSLACDCEFASCIAVAVIFFLLYSPCAAQPRVSLLLLTYIQPIFRRMGPFLGQNEFRRWQKRGGGQGNTSAPSF